MIIWDTVTLDRWLDFERYLTSLSDRQFKITIAILQGQTLEDIHLFDPNISGIDLYTIKEELYSSLRNILGASGAKRANPN